MTENSVKEKIYAFRAHFKLWRLIYLSGLLMALTIVVGVYFRDNELAFILVGAIGILYVPVLSGVGWLYIWREFEDPVKFLGYWCSAVQFVNLAINLIRIRSSAWGITGMAMTFATTTLIAIYMKGYFRRWKGKLVTVILIIFTTVTTFWLILENLDNLNPWMIISTSEGYPWMIDESTSLSLLGGILTYMGILNVLISLAPQVFLLDLENKIREYRFIDATFESLDSEVKLSSLRPQSVIQKPEAPVRAVRLGRIQFIDFARGVVMIIMAWDHLAGFWGKYKGGKMLIGNAPFPKVFAWFMSRFNTHYCAPTFIFIAGTVLAISTAKRLGRGDSQRAVSFRMVKRGILLLFLQFFVVNGVWDKQGNFYSYLFGVIACIGSCFIIFSIVRRLPSNVILALSLFIILNHQFLSLDWIPDHTWWGYYLRVIIHEPNEFYWYPFFGRYPIIPWIGVMGLGWVFGRYLTNRDLSRLGELKVRLVAVGVAAKALCVLVRFFNGYGNLRPRMDNSLWEWLWLAKYPPSVGFLLWSWAGCVS